MKYIRLHTNGQYVIGIQRPLGLVERVFATQGDGPNDEEQSRRTVSALNACADLTDGTLQLLANGGNENGTMVERLAMSAIAWRMNSRTAMRYLSAAREELAKMRGKL